MNYLKSLSLLFSALLLIFATSINVFAKDVVPGKGGHKSIEVTLTTDQSRVSFKLCSDLTGIKKCMPIGLKKDYSVSELNEQRNIEGAQAIALTVAYAAFTVGTSVITYGMYVGFPYDLWAAYMFGGGALATGITLSIVDATNPAEQWRQTLTISTKVISDQKVVVESGFFETADQKIVAMAKSLRTVLNKLEK